MCDDESSAESDDHGEEQREPQTDRAVLPIQLGFLVRVQPGLPLPPCSSSTRAEQTCVETSP
jgi:hypothetical protein